MRNTRCQDHGNRMKGLAVLAIAFACANARAQRPPAVRTLGKIERVSTDSLASVATALPMPGGRVMVNDITARRLLLFDSTLTRAVAIADQTGATGNAYGDQAGTLIAYRGDSALFIDPASLSMLELDPAGKIARVMAIPRPDESRFLAGDVFGTPGVDRRGRLVYYSGPNPSGGFMTLGAANRATRPDGSPWYPPIPDSAFVVRIDLETRVLDTAVSIRIPKRKVTVNGDAQGNAVSIQTTNDPIPIVDDWVVLRDGTIAVVRGRDYHVDWIAPDGKVTSSAKLPFDWQRLDETRKAAIIDSAVATDQSFLRPPPGTTPRGTVARGGAGGAGNGRAALLPMVAGRPEPGEVSDYLPAFRRGAIHIDAESNLWIRTSTLVKGQPVYDVVNRRGELFDRVQLPPFRTIAGFGPGVVYMAVLDSARVAHVERARVK